MRSKIPNIFIKLAFVIFVLFIVLQYVVSAAFLFDPLFWLYISLLIIGMIRGFIKKDRISLYLGLLLILVPFVWVFVSMYFTS